MRTSELIEEIEVKTGAQASEILKIFYAYADIVSQNLEHGCSTPFPGLGTFGVIHHEERKAINTRTDETIFIEAYNSPKFYLNKNLQKAPITNKKNDRSRETKNYVSKQR